MMFLDNPDNEEIFEIMEENKDIKEVKKELDKITQDEILWKEALDIEITRMDNEQYIEDAENRGMKKAKLETAKKLLVAKVPIKIIMEATELSEEEISKLKG